MTKECPALARDARGRGAACIVVGSELDLEPRLATSPLASAGRRASGTIVRLFDAVCFAIVLMSTRNQRVGEGCRGPLGWGICLAPILRKAS